MKTNLKHSISLFISFVMLLSLFSVSTFGADNEQVLTSMSHSAGNMVLNGTTATLTVPFNHNETVNLQEVTYTFSDADYTDVSTSFQNSTLVLPGSSTIMNVSYRNIGDETVYSTEYIINVVRDVGPSFTGSISKTITLPSSTITFTQNDFLNCYTKNSGEDLTSISITGTSNQVGSLKLSGSSYALGELINRADLSKVTFDASTAGTATYTVYAFNAASSERIGSVTLTITVNGAASSSLTLNSYTASSTVSRGSIWNIASSHFSYTPTSPTIKYVRISSTPASSSGYLYLTTSLPSSSANGYSAISSNTVLATGAIIPVSYLQYLRLYTYPNSTSNSISFSWTATTASSATGASWASSVSYTVNFTSSSSSSGDNIVDYSTNRNTAVTLVASDFNTAFKNVTGNTLSYIQFTLPSTSIGRLYYNYTSSSNYGSTVSSSTKYYRSSTPSISNVTFVPASNYTGNATINFTSYDSSGNKESGKLYIYVDSSGYEGGSVTYTTSKNSNVKLVSSDFNTAFRDETGSTLNYIQFTLPSTSIGRLYYNYTSASKYDSTVSSSTRYYRSTTPSISNVTFVPSSSYTGKATIKYTAYDSSGNSYEGTLYINVGVSDYEGGSVTYTTSRNSNVKLSASDFNTAFRNETGLTLSYIQFKLPSTSIGRLYYNYTSSSKYDSIVSSSTKYYRTSTPTISDITFVPSSSYVGRATITYTAYDSSGNDYEGRLYINVGLSEYEGGSVTYSTAINRSVRLNASDFNTSFKNETDYNLSYITFTLPSTSVGRLYYDYISSSDYDSTVSSSTKYYRSSDPNISDITFVPSSSYTGKVTITYTAYDNNGESYEGKLYINVGTSEYDDGSVSYRTGVNSKIELNASDFNAAFRSETGNNLSYINFDALPSSSYGRLYYDYTDADDYDSVVSTSTKYYRSSSPNISDITFVPYNGYTGTVTIYYTAYDSDDESADGKLYITVDPQSGSGEQIVSYTTMEDNTVSFSTNDFTKALKDATGSTLSYIEFTLPSASYGKLNYDNTNDYSSGHSSTVMSGTKYYVNFAPHISNISFTPASGYTGTLNINYTSYDGYGYNHKGTVEITVTPDPTKLPVYPLPTGWAKAEVESIAKRNVVPIELLNDYETNITRAEFTAVMVNIYEYCKGAVYTDKVSKFADTSNNVYFNQIEKGYMLDIISGTSETKFSPDATLTREQAARILCTTLSSIDNVDISSTEPLTYNDTANISDWAKVYVSYSKEHGLMVGGGSNFHPRSQLTRQEALAIAERLIVKYNWEK